MSKKYGIDFSAVAKAIDWKGWDEEYTRKAVPQYKTLEQYYKASSSLKLISNVKRPTLVIHSKDDPIVPINCLPVDVCVKNPRFIVGIVEKGGHVCYFQGVNG
jgi:predicted alpha/beta-fold hydrolase